MKNNYTWEIESLDYAISAENQANVITNIHWRLLGTDGEFSGTVYGSWGIDFDAKVAFTAYDALTESIVLGWLKTSMGDEHIASLKEAVDAQIETQANPTTGYGLPWTN